MSFTERNGGITRLRVIFPFNRTGCITETVKKIYRVASGR